MCTHRVTWQIVIEHDTDEWPEDRHTEILQGSTEFITNITGDRVKNTALDIVKAQETKKGGVEDGATR